MKEVVPPEEKKSTVQSHRNIKSWMEKEEGEEESKTEQKHEIEEISDDNTAHTFESTVQSSWFESDQPAKKATEILSSVQTVGDPGGTDIQNRTEYEQDYKNKSELRLALKQKLHKQFQNNSSHQIEKKDKENTEAVKEKRKKTRAKWKESLSLVLKDSERGVVSEEAAYDFFTRIWESEEPSFTSTPLNDDTTEDAHSSKRQPDILDESEKIEELTERATDETHLLIEDYFQTEADKYIPVQRKAIYIPSNEQIEVENKIYFYPAAKSVPTDAKITEGKKPRDIEDEGLYVGKYPSITSHNIRKLENRFLKQQDKKWFGDNGKIKMQPDPCKKVPSRPLPLIKQNENLESTYRKAIVGNKENWLFDRHKNPEIWHQLDIDICNISFNHHSLFSKEHVLVARLVELVKSYNGYLLTDKGVSLSQRLQALRSAVNQLKQMSKQDEDNRIAEEREERLCHYQEDIKQIRKLRDARDVENKQLLIAIKNLWEEIQNLRETQKYASSPVELTIHEEYIDLDDDQKMWNKEIEEELEEEKLMFNINYKQELKEYQTKLEKWKKLHKLKKQALQSKKSKKKLSRQNTEEELATDSKNEESEIASKTEEIISLEDMPKPQPPSKFDEERTLEIITEKALEIRRKPGEPKLFPEITNSGIVTSASNCSKLEQARRNEVSKRKIYFKIFYNNKQVCQTTERSLGQEFTASWGQIFKLCIVHKPQNVKIEIFEKNGVLSTRLADIWLPLPDPSLTTNNVQLLDQEFCSEEVITYRHAGIGSGIAIHYLKDDQATWLLTNGILKCSLAWGINKEGKSLGPKITKEASAELRSLHEFDKLMQIISTGLASIQGLRNWVEQCHLDPNDPANSCIFHAMQYYNLYFNKSNQNSIDYFRLEPLQSEFDFVTEEELNNNSRFQLLQLRSHEAPEFRNYHMIPAYENEIPKDILQTMEHHQIPERRGSKGVPESHREKASKLLKQIREQVLKRFYAAQHQRVLEDVVIEEEVPSIQTLGFSLFSLMQTQRPLCPTRKERKKMTGQTVASTDINIIVTVMHALNVPVRVDNDILRGTIKHSLSGKESITDRLNASVRPYVEVMFQRETARTHVNEGPHPTWNQELHLPFKAPSDDYSPTNLETVQDIIYLSLFDEVVIDVLEDDRDRDSTVHTKMERHWLGDLKIPFTTLYLNSKIEGTFRLNVPPVLLGYDYEARPWLMRGMSNELEGRHTYLSLFLTIEPCLQLPEVFRQKYESLEPERILQEVDVWDSEFRLLFPDRSIRTMAIDISGKWILIPRYLCPLKPPEQMIDSLQDKMEIMETLARFVSVIPTRSDSVVFPGICDIWSTCDQFLQMLMGDEEEHAVLLCNYFLHIKIRAMLLLGSAIPEGLTSYVITWDDKDNIWVWNASLGQRFNIQDSYSPLRHVYCLISSDNIWANIQKTDIPSQMNFDLNLTKDWRPFFRRNFPNPGLNTIQSSNLSYSPVDLQFAQKLQEELEIMLKDSIMKWRRRFRTSWNRHCMQALRNILPRLEKNFGRTASLESLRELEQILTSYKMWGFPLSMPYTDEKAVVDAVYASGVHRLEEKNMEFAIAVYVHPYPCSVFAVWIYVAALKRRS
ncbi:coiled-coil and C2 domain-containing protein 2A-like isoform X2 [Centruroides vittatus]